MVGLQSVGSVGLVGQKSHGLLVWYGPFGPLVPLFGWLSFCSINVLLCCQIINGLSSVAGGSVLGPSVWFVHSQLS